jgi:NAD(P)-dependent dehydrogenase (short-subunit alcohol dehydrogenase family)
VKSDQLFNVQGYGVIVTGAASGLGLGYTEALAENGASVTMLDVDAERMAHETQRLQALGYAVRSEVLDVRDHAALERVFDAALAAYGLLDVVFAMPASIRVRDSSAVGSVRSDRAMRKARCGITPMSAGSASSTST